ncbi:MAG: cohesin domain-containing protein [Desulfuromonadales bacterium]|nr:cohesin domain-containing protein [Desulfuromonadales bacterium]
MGAWNNNERQPLPVGALLLLLILLCTRPATAGEIILSGGNGQWQINATGLTNVHALDLELRYDPQHLAGLTATAGTALAGTLAAINDKVPGTIRLGVASSQPLAQNGTLLNLQSSLPGAELRVSRFTVKSVDADGKVVATTVRQLAALNSKTEPLTDNPKQVVEAIATSRRTGTSNGSVVPPEVLPSPPTPPNREPLPIPATTIAAASTSTTTAPSAFSRAEKRFHSQEEIVRVIERLPQPWTVAAIKAIFLHPASDSQVRQIPPVALADGSSKIMLYLPKSLSQQTPAVGVQGCVLGAISDAGELGWEVGLITSRDIWPAKALLSGEGDLIQFPVVIVPVLAITPPKEESGPIPAVDFDGDASITALDAYLYVGNLLARQEPQ